MWMRTRSKRCVHRFQLSVLRCVCPYPRSCPWGLVAGVWWFDWLLAPGASEHCFGPKLTKNLGLLDARFWFSGQPAGQQKGSAAGRIALQCIALHRPQMQQVLFCCILADYGNRQPVVEQRHEHGVTQRRLYQFMVEFGLFSLAVDFCLVLACACLRVHV